MIGGEEYVTRSTGHSMLFANATNMHNDERKNESTDEVKVKDVKERGCWKEDIGRGYWKEDIGNCSKREV